MSTSRGHDEISSYRSDSEEIPRIWPMSDQRYAAHCPISAEAGRVEKKEGIKEDKVEVGKATG